MATVENHSACSTFMAPPSAAPSPMDVCGLDDEQVTSIEGKGVDVEESGWLILESDPKRDQVGRYKLPHKYLKHIPYFTTLLEDKTCCRATIPQPNEVLGDIVAFLLIEQGTTTPRVPKPLRFDTLAECLPQALPQVNFIEALWAKKGRAHFKDFTESANYLLMDGLLHLCCARLGIDDKEKAAKKKATETTEG